jgi:hypothetical protein
VPVTTSNLLVILTRAPRPRLSGCTVQVAFMCFRVDKLWERGPVTLANASNTTMTIQSIRAAPGVYAGTNNCGSSLGPGAELHDHPHL